MVIAAPVLAVDAICGSPACHGRRCARVRHGYVRGELRGRCSQHRGCRAFELDELAACEPLSTTVHAPAELAPLDSPAGEDGEVSGVAPAPAQGDLPGTNPAPVGPLVRHHIYAERATDA